MSWRALTKADILSKLPQLELDAIVAATDVADEATLLATAIADVTGTVRGYVDAFPGNSLDATTDTVPDVLVGVAVDLLVFDLMPPTGIDALDPTGRRQKAYDRAYQTLRDCAAGKFRVPQPPTPTTDAYDSPSPSFDAPDRNFTNTTQDGI